MIPIRCLSCGKPVSAYFDDYNKRVAAGEKSKDVLDDLGLNRYCCRRMLISHVETWE
ncbi:DNA-directed RNA polymerase subunit N [Methanobrevibacter sp.]|uniref:DNA-directed RNA polymerase subunit N n=1 Tax=Methanobrevibacter sp. TaxID=66852 RepID=UPI0025F53473|nr:DNA-directed RNA polymerase subunit N [Methanobrevibacter sp.]MBQ6511956.1 DNA-directed RNA polymerase subunit N [Methanobrevibacter sp.]